MSLSSSKSLDPAKVFFGPRAEPTEIGLPPSGFLSPKKDGPKKTDAYSGPKKDLKSLSGGKWQPKHLPKPEFLEAKVTPGAAKKTKDVDAAKAKVESAEGEVAAAKAEYEKYDNSAKAFKATGNPLAKIFESKALVAKKKYEQKVVALHVAEKKLASLAPKPGSPKSGMAPKGEELSGPTGATLAKHHSTLSAGKPLPV